MRVLLVVVVLAVGCGGGGDDASGDDTPAVDADVPGADGPVAQPTTPYCTAGCTTAADCATGGAGTILDADNYRCDAGVCVWLGCLSTQECMATYPQGEYVCDGGCWPACSTPADCANPDSAILGEDNYDCTGGRCAWTGCNSTAECIEAYGTPDWRCEARGGSTVASCWPTCTSPADCASAHPAFDVDNYACNDGVCEYTGCNSTKECTAIDVDYVCPE